MLLKQVLPQWFINKQNLKKKKKIPEIGRAQE